MHFPIKYGFMNVSHGQIVFISNYGVDQMFPKESLPAIKTRLWEIDFDLEGNNGPFPLVCPTSQSRLFVFDLLTKHEMVNVKTSLVVDHDEIRQLVDQDEIQQEQNELRREQEQDLLTDSGGRFEEEKNDRPNFYSPCRFLEEEVVLEDQGRALEASVSNNQDGDQFWDLEGQNEEMMMFFDPEEFVEEEEEEDGKNINIYIFNLTSSSCYNRR